MWWGDDAVSITRPTNEDTEHHAQWLELFYDLVVVASVAIISESITPGASVVHEIWNYSAALGLFLIWLMTTLVFNKFPPNDDPTSLPDSAWRALRTLTLFVQMVAVTVVVLAVNQEEDSISNEAGIVALGVALLAMAATAAVSVRVHHTTAPVVRLVVVLFAALSVPLMASAWLSSAWQAAIFVVTVIALVCSFIIFVRDGSRPIDFLHLQERMGLLFIIALGEAILALTFGFAERYEIPDLPLFIVALLFPLAAFIMYIRIPPLVQGTVPPIVIWVFVSFLLIAALEGAGAALANRAIHPELLEVPGVTDRTTIRFSLALIAAAVLCLIGRRLTRSPAAVYGVAALLTVLASVVGSRQSWAGESLVISQFLILLTAVIVADVLAGSAKRKMASKSAA